jgi:hypothetical protein
MATWPQTLYPKFGYSSYLDEFKSRSNPSSGRHQEKDIWNRTRFNASMEYDLRTVDALIVYGFWKTNRNTFFDFYDFDVDIFITENIGTGTGALTTFTVPGKKITSVSVFVNAVQKFVGVDWDLSSGTGAIGQDQIIFRAGHIPAAAAPITINYVGQHWYNCIYKNRPDKTSANLNRLSLKIDVMESFNP